jgi:hypothetical protein
MLTASERAQVLKVLEAYAPIRALIADPPRVPRNAPQPRTASLRRLPLAERIAWEKSQKLRASRRAAMIRAKSLAHNHQQIAEIMAQG